MPDQSDRPSPGLRAERVVAGYSRREPVVRGATLTVAPGESVGMLGPSGCGKSTLARVLALLHVPYAGTVSIDGEAVTRWRFRAPRALRTRVGVLFQQPRLSVDPRMRLSDVIAEPLRATGQGDRAAERTAELAELTGLTGDLLGRRPHEVSDGQLQRACLARALALRPAYLVCDEMTSMLDASTTAALVAVVERYRAESGAGLLAVSHDSVLLGRWCGRVTTYAEVTGDGPAGGVAAAEPAGSAATADPEHFEHFERSGDGTEAADAAGGLDAAGPPDAVVAGRAAGADGTGDADRGTA